MGGFGAALSRYAVFEGRSRRREYWGFMVGLWLIGLTIGILYVGGGASVESSGEGSWLSVAALVLAGLVGIAFFIPTLAVGWRRCHDVGIPGGVAIIGLFVPLVIYIIALIPGNTGPNEYGPDPKA